MSIQFITIEPATKTVTVAYVPDASGPRRVPISYAEAADKLGIDAEKLVAKLDAHASSK